MTQKSRYPRAQHTITAVRATADRHSRIFSIFLSGDQSTQRYGALSTYGLIISSTGALHSLIFFRAFFLME